MNTTHELPTKVKALISSLDRKQIGYTMEITKQDEHHITYIVKAVEGLWFEASVTSYFTHRVGHISEYGYKWNTSTRHMTWISGGTCKPEKTSSAVAAMILWEVYGTRHASKVGA